jgi:hypothetical protein
MPGTCDGVRAAEVDDAQLTQRSEAGDRPRAGHARVRAQLQDAGAARRQRAIRRVPQLNAPGMHSTTRMR